MTTLVVQPTITTQSWCLKVLGIQSMMELFALILISNTFFSLFFHEFRSFKTHCFILAAYLNTVARIVSSALLLFFSPQWMAPSRWSSNSEPLVYRVLLSFMWIVLFCLFLIAVSSQVTSWAAVGVYHTAIPSLFMNIFDYLLSC